MKWTDLEPGDKLKLTTELKNVITNNDAWTNKVWLNFEAFTVSKVKNDGNFILVWIEEVDSGLFWLMNHKGEIYFNGGIPAFEVVELAGE